jgi:hypothetical protein
VARVQHCAIYQSTLRASSVGANRLDTSRNASILFRQHGNDLRQLAFADSVVIL